MWIYTCGYIRYIQIYIFIYIRECVRIQLREVRARMGRDII
jgi:hypothetical protein